MIEKQKKMKTMLIPLLLLSVIATSALIGTLGKYVTSSTVSDTAVVAKFGLNIPNTINLFSDSYTNVSADTDGKKIIAPGTSGKYDFKITGTSEVAYKVGADVTVTYSEDWGAYKPLEFSINGEDWTNLEEFKEDLATELESEILQPNDAYTNEQTIYWRWPFYVSPEDDAKDTVVGLAAAAGTAPKVTLNIEVTATQID